MKTRRIPKHLLLEPQPKRKAHRWVGSIILLLIIGLFTLVAVKANSQEMADSHAGQLVFQREGQTLTPSNIRTQQATHVATQADADISGLVVNVQYQQEFRNDSDEWVEGIYTFPLPESAAIHHMEIHLGNRIIVGEIHPKQKAKEIYQHALKAGKQAALTEQQRPNLFTQRIANIAPHQTLTVTIAFTDKAEYRHSEFTWRLPTTLTPRFIPGISALPPQNHGQENIEVHASGWALTPAQREDANAISPPISHLAHNPLSMNINLHTGGLTFADVSSLYHDIRIERQSNKQGNSESNEQYHITFQQPEEMDRDFVLRWQPVLSQKPQAAIFQQRIDNDYFTLLMVLPPEANKQTHLNRDLLFIIDTSGSMQGTAIEQAKASLTYALNQLTPADNFNIIEFNSDYSLLFARPQIADEQNIATATHWIAQLEADGGTEMQNALDAAFLQTANSQHLAQVVFITDGAVGNESALFQRIEQQAGDARLFTVGIGTAPNTWFMKKAAQFGRGTYEYIADANEVQQHMRRLFTKLDSAVAKNLIVNWPSDAEVYPQHIGDLYADEPLVAIAKLTSPPEELKVAGESAGVTTSNHWLKKVTAPNAAKSQGIGSLWARDKIAAIEDAGHRGLLSKEEVEEQVLPVALRHHLLSRFTSFVAVDKAIVRPSEAKLKQDTLANQLAKGQVLQARQALAMPQTATSSTLTFWLGLVCFGAFVFIQGLLRDK